jgi:hypothetical protein
MKSTAGIWSLQPCYESAVCERMWCGLAFSFPRQCFFRHLSCFVCSAVGLQQTKDNVKPIYKLLVGAMNAVDPSLLVANLSIPTQYFTCTIAQSSCQLSCYQSHFVFFTVSQMMKGSFWQLSKQVLENGYRWRSACKSAKLTDYAVIWHVKRKSLQQIMVREKVCNRLLLLYTTLESEQDKYYDDGVNMS